jgi:mono/diheme cytochrome c family protein
LGEVERALPDRALGQRVYLADCAACHGDRGQGTPLGSPLAVPNRKAAGRTAFYRALVEGAPGTAMPRYSGYDAATLRSLIDYTGSLPNVPGSRAEWKQGSGDAASGKLLFNRWCAGCHGDAGQGLTGPGLATPGFQKAASAEFVAITIMRGRAGTPMPAFGRDSVNYPKLSAQDVLDLAAFVRGALGATAEARQVTEQRAGKDGGKLQ